MNGKAEVGERKVPSGMGRWILPTGALILGVLLLAVWVQAVSAAPQGVQGETFDLRITKSQLPPFFSVGSGNYYLINVSRVNTETIPGAVVVQDNLPAGLTWTPQNVGLWNCVDASTPTQVNCYYTASNPANFDQLAVQVTVPPTAPAIFTNTARLLTTDLNPANNVSSVRTILSSSADLQLKKSVSHPSISVGGVATYTLVYSNAGPAPATGVVVTDLVPSGLSIVLPVVPPTSSQIGNELSWNIGSLSAGQVGTITVRVNAGSAGAFTNRAGVRANEQDWNTGNNIVTATLVSGNLVITKTASLTTALAGQPFTYTIRVSNPNALAGLASITVTDTLDARLDFVRSLPARTPDANRTLTFSNIPVPYTIYIVVKPKTTVDIPQVVTNTATVSWRVGSSPRVYRQADPVPVTVRPGGVFSLAKSDGLSLVDPNQAITYTITVANVGNLPLRGVVLTDTLPTYVTPLAIEQSPDDWTASCSVSARRCTLSLNDPLAPEDEFSFYIRARVDRNAPPGTLTNQILARGTYRYASDPEQTVSVVAVDTTRVRAQEEYDLDASKAVSPQQAKVNENFTFRIVVRNNGDQVAEDVVINDTFPTALDLVNATTTRGTATINSSTRRLTVEVGDLNPSQAVRVDVTAKVNSTVTQAQTLENQARVTFSDGAVSSNIVRFRVLPSGTLPGTGWPPLGSEAAAGPLPTVLALGSVWLAAGIAALLLGLFALGLALLIRLRYPLRGRGLARLGLGLVVVGVLVSLTGWALGISQPALPTPGGLLSLGGTKPPLATQEASPTSPFSLLPTATEIDVEWIDFGPTPTPLVLPDYPIPTPNVVVTSGPLGIPPDDSPVTRLVIPAIGLDAEVKFVPFNGETWLIGGLRQEIAWMGDTSWPGLGGNTGLAGHVDLADGSAGPFWNLKDLRPGDLVMVYTERYIFTYRVREQRVVADYDLSVVAPTEQPQITLITCIEWDSELRTYLKRLVVFADLVQVQPLGGGGN